MCHIGRCAELGYLSVMIQTFVMRIAKALRQIRADVQADLSLCWAHRSFYWYLGHICRSDYLDFVRSRPEVNSSARHICQILKIQVIRICLVVISPCDYILICNIYIFIAIALDETTILVTIHFSIKTFTSHVILAVRNNILCLLTFA